MQIIDGGITAPKGYSAAGVYSGIKKKNKDMALVYSQVPARTAGTFTVNRVKAAPVLWNQTLVNEVGVGQAFIINSGVANACTGQVGKENNETMAKLTADALGIKANEVYVASTGVIGKQLPMNIIEQGIKALVPKLDTTFESGVEAAEAIMTTDTYKKDIAVSIQLGGKTVHIGGMAKGSGMIHPNMATMLSFVTTDCLISKDLLKEALKQSVSKSYNMISVDGDTSTNDMVLVMANGLAENPEITEKNEDYDKFVEALDYLNTHLAKAIAADGEGATKLLEVNVKGAKTKEDAVLLSKSIIHSSLVKTAIFGEDANWGRIICAMGYSSADFDPDQVEISFESQRGKIIIVEKGMGTDYSETEATHILGDRSVKLNITLNDGEENATAWGCDLSYDYVKINADYRT
jgi:glutamate N-acetyltransferase/amino-acid N-acetyltransferase